LTLPCWQAAFWFKALKEKEQAMRKLFAAAIVLLLSEGVTAQDHQTHMQHDMGAMAGENQTAPSTKAYKDAMAKMHGDMAIPYSGNANVDFVRGMIPHHQGAIDMAKAMLEHGTDPELKTLAQDIITAQEQEIAWMREWLARQGQ
jgi:uncharacterized protein (DUF305 family)